jgi:hypothetical protein
LVGLLLTLAQDSQHECRCSLLAEHQLSPGLGRQLGRGFSFHDRCAALEYTALAKSTDIGRMRKMPPAIRYGIDALLILVPLLAMTYFLFDPAAFNAFTAWLARVL